MQPQKFSLGDTGQPVKELQEFLRSFGYLNAFEESSGTFDSTTVNALRSYQQFNGLSITGDLDNTTAEHMNIPRCGVPDDPSNLPTLNFTTNGLRWNKTNLTYRFNRFTPDISQADVRTAIRTAFNLWSQITPLTFTEINTGTPDVLLDFVPNIPPTPVSDPIAISSSNSRSNTITDNQIDFDDSEVWELAIPITRTSFDLVAVATHEIGHSLGLGHSPIQTAIMRSSFNSGTSQRFLDSDDINGIQSIYGSRVGGWESLGGTLAYTPEVCSWAAGRLDIFVRGSDNTLQHKWFDGSWSGWESLGGTLASDPTAVSWGNRRIDVFIRASDNTLQHKWFDSRWKP